MLKDTVIIIVDTKSGKLLVSDSDKVLDGVVEVHVSSGGVKLIGENGAAINGGLKPFGENGATVVAYAAKNFEKQKVANADLGLAQRSIAKRFGCCDEE